MAVNKNKKRAGSRRVKHRGGGAGIGGYAFTGASIMPGLGNAAVNQPQMSCQSAARPEVTVGQPGLPGMVGGRYGFVDPTQFAPSTPFNGGLAPTTAIPCESAATTRNPLNQLGGAPGGIGSPFYTAPTAGYGNMPSSWVGSTGAPVMEIVGAPARILNPACLTTGGARRAKTAKSRRAKSVKSRRAKSAKSRGAKSRGAKSRSTKRR
jgi:hypothetical protein